MAYQPPPTQKKINLRVSKSVNSQLISKVKLIKIHKWLSIYIYISQQQEHEHEQEQEKD
jgi:hypothetical protein